MKIRYLFGIFFLIWISACQDNTSGESYTNTTNKTYNEGINITPNPVSIQAFEGEFSIDKNTVIVVSDNAIENSIATLIHARFSEATGLDLNITTEKTANNAIVLKLEEGENSTIGAYILKSSSDLVELQASTPEGLFYAAQTLFQLLPAEIESRVSQKMSNWKIPSVDIQDQPAFAWRGMMLDVCRHFISIESIKRQLDVMAMLKMNKFHWHLTEDQGWRIEIKKYPKLTQIGGSRVESDGSTHKGYYTQEEIKEVVAYAQARYIDVIPEIETPGHALAALSAYPNLACHPSDFSPRIIWGVEEHIFCAGKEETFEFIEDVLEEVVALFPYEYVHVGGDEVPKAQWEECANCKKRRIAEELSDSNALQGYFMKRVEKILHAKGRKMIGWDEIMDSGVSNTASVMSWRGEEGGIKAANMGNDVIMTPAKFTYLNFYQGDAKILPIAFGSFIPIENLYQYNPIPEAILPENRSRILGAQCNLWTEYIYKERTAEQQLYPRLFALAETTWTKAENKDFKDFQRRLANQLVRLDHKGVEYYIPIPEGHTNHLAFTDSITVELSVPETVEKVVYTVDGSDPDASSTVLEGSLTFTQKGTLKVASVLPHGKLGSTRTIAIDKQQMLPAHPIETKPGLETQTAMGKFLWVSQLDSVSEWKSGAVDSLAQANTTLNWGHYVDENQFRAVVISGYIEVPESGVYYFSSDQEQVWIANKLVINNDGEVKRHSRKDGALALTKGKHPLKIIYFNNIYGGWASDWNTVELRYRHAQDSDYRIADGTMLSH